MPEGSVIMSAPVRVLHVLQRMEPAGVQMLLMNLYRHMDREKVQFDFLVHYTAPQFFDKEIEKLGGKIYRLSVREDYNFFRYWHQLNFFFREHPEYRIVHGHMHSLGMFYLSAAEKNGVPVRIAHAHTNGILNDAKKQIKQYMNNHFADHATDLFACSESAGKFMFGQKTYRVINNAIDSTLFCFDANKRQEKRRELGIDDQFVIGCVGRFTPEKNQKYSIDVFRKVLKRRENATLLLIGSGPMEQEVKAYAAANGLDGKTLFIGNRRDMPELYMAMDVFLFPSVFEGLGIVGVEAQAAGTPTVATDTLPREISVTPLIHRLPLGNVEEWADMIEMAYRDPERHQNMMHYIQSASYDITGVASWLQDFYLSKAAENE